MKPIPLLLAASLLANVVFVATHAFRGSDSDCASATPSAASGANTSAPSARAAGKEVSTENLVAALKANDLAALRDLLRAAGVPDDTIRMVLSSAVWRRYSEHMKSLRPKSNDATWWKNDQDWYRQTTREQRAEMRRLQREAQDEIERLVGKKNDDNWWSDNRYAFLSEDKRKDVQEIEQDYQDLLQEIQQEIQGLTLPSDTEKIKYLLEEKKRDLAGILSPQELAEYELRMSPVASQLRWKMTKFDATEDEYRKIFALQQAAYADLPTDAWGNPLNTGNDDWKKRQERDKLLASQLKDALGAERYAEYVRSQNYEYQQLTSLTKRLSLPPETANNVYALRDSVSTSAQRIADNPDLSVDQKKQAFSNLAKTTRDQVRAALGDEAATAIFKSGMSWLNNVENGQVVTFGDDGSQNTRSGINPPAKKSAK